MRVWHLRLKPSRPHTTRGRTQSTFDFARSYPRPTCTSIHQLYSFIHSSRFRWKIIFLTRRAGPSAFETQPAPPATRGRTQSSPDLARSYPDLLVPVVARLRRRLRPLASASDTPRTRAAAETTRHHGNRVPRPHRMPPPSQRPTLYRVGPKTEQLLYCDRYFEG